MSTARRVDYQQKFRFNWLNDPKYKDWLKPVENDRSRAYCTFCRVGTYAKLSDLKKHLISKKHRAAAEKHGIRYALSPSPSMSSSQPEQGHLSNTFEMGENGHSSGRIPLADTVIGFIGAGKMAQSIAQGLLLSGVVIPSQVYATAPSTSNAEWWRNRGVDFCQKSNTQIVNVCDVIFLAMKPQQLPSTLSQLGVEAAGVRQKQKQIVISVVSGVTLSQLSEGLVAARLVEPMIFRIVTNTAAEIRKSCSVYSTLPSSDLESKKKVKALLGSFGLVEEVPESQLNQFTALIGSGPAFMYVIIEALADGAVKSGLPRALALKFAAQMVSGASSMVLESGKHPGQLKDEVCSPAGTTIHGIGELENRGVRAAMMNAIQAAANRCQELSQFVSK